jgi:hypothetical protein
VLRVAGARDPGELGKVLVNELGDLDALRHVVDGQHQHLGLGRASNAQQVEP